MADKKKKIPRVQRAQFPKDATADQILTGIEKIQDEWAKRNPVRAHQLYPNVYDAQGNLIKAATDKGK